MSSGAAAVDEESIAVAVPWDASESGLASLLGAAYLMMDRAFVRIEGGREKTVEIVLKSKTPATPAQLELLARDFRAELETQKVRWAIARDNLAIRQRIVEEAVLSTGAEAKP